MEVIPQGLFGTYMAKQCFVPSIAVCRRFQGGGGAYTFSSREDERTRSARLVRDSSGCSITRDLQATLAAQIKHRLGESGWGRHYLRI